MRRETLVITPLSAFILLILLIVTLSSQNISNKLANRIVCAIYIALTIVISTGCSHKNVNQSGSYPANKDQIDVAYQGKISQQRKNLLYLSRQWLGTPYKYAASEKGIGTDCSGMVLSVYEEATSIKLPRNSAKQADFCNSVNDEDVKPGDLVFFATNRNSDKISHVGIMLDRESFIHASASKGVVISSLKNPYYANSFKKFGRIPNFK